MILFYFLLGENINVTRLVWSAYLGWICIYELFVFFYLQKEQCILIGI